MKVEKTRLPPQTLAGLERRDSSSSRFFRIGLGRLIVFSNLAGLLIAVLAWTNGIAILLLFPLAFILPAIVFLILVLVSLHATTTTSKHDSRAVSYTHLRAHETREDLVCRLLLEKKKE